MPRTLYNTASQKKEPFIPLEEGKAKISVCGPTVYDAAHIGHARCYIVFDILVRYLRYLGFDVLFTRQFTDLDDKIIKRAQEEGQEYIELAERYISLFHQDMDALGLLRPDLEPRATEYIDLMVADIQSLVEKGYAYHTDTDVFYDISKYDDYGSLSGRELEDLQAGARVEVDPNKKNPLDFVLWKKSKPAEPSWDSPWGPGRPGWHIECSAISAHFLGPEFDIHGGGQDLIFPHHENEIAQAKPLGRNFARYWMHNGFVRVDHRKMSKSLKNFWPIQDVLAHFHPEVLRLFVISRHYRSPVDFSDGAIIEISRGLERAYRTLKKAEKALGEMEIQKASSTKCPVLDAFREAMDDDLNTARALGHVFEAVRELNKIMDGGQPQDMDLDQVNAWVAAIRDMGGILGILTHDPDQFLEYGQSKSQAVSGLSREEIEELIAVRTRARKAKDWDKADSIRNQLKDNGVLLEDVGAETRWRFET